MAQSFWIGMAPLRCDLCKTDIVDEFIDGGTRHGPWGFMCPTCHQVHGVGLGMGRGQRYRREAEGEITCTAAEATAFRGEPSPEVRAVRRFVKVEG